MFDEKVFTAEDIAQHLRVPVEAIESEISAGRLRALNIGGYIRIREADLNAFKGVASSAISKMAPNGGAGEWGKAPDFRHVWPDGTAEQFSDASERVISESGRSRHVKIGFTNREAAGRMRRRGLVIVDRYPTVEFVAADDVSREQQMASIIKDRAGKQIPSTAPAPVEYSGVPVGCYRDVVDGPGASNGLAVICSSSDLDTMAQHALIRYRYRAERD